MFFYTDIKWEIVVREWLLGYLPRGRYKLSRALVQISHLIFSSGMRWNQICSVSGDQYLVRWAICRFYWSAPAL